MNGPRLHGRCARQHLGLRRGLLLTAKAAPHKSVNVFEFIAFGPGCMLGTSQPVGILYYDPAPGQIHGMGTYFRRNDLRYLIES